MSWMSALIETYDNYFNGVELEDPQPLIPVGFIEKKVGIRVNIERNSTCAHATLINDDEILCIPSDPAAESRTGSKALPYPLSAEIHYTAGDLSDFTEKDKKEYYCACFNAYINKLREWCDSQDSPEELHILLKYLEKKTLARDLIEHRAIVKDKDGVFPASKRKVFVDFCVYTDSEYSSLSKLDSVRLSWQRILCGTISDDKGLCYSSGDIEPIRATHAKIDGNAKLISSKDDSRPFQYKGRFLDAEQACTVGYYSSAKIHNTIRWLKNRQGFQRHGLTFIAWSTSCRKIITPSFGLDEDEEKREIIFSEEIYGRNIRDTMAGYMKSPAYKEDSKIVMLGMEAATTGRLSIDFYQELDGRQYLDNLSKWYCSCLWRIPIKKDCIIKYYVTTPTINDMSEAVFGIDNVKIARRDNKAEKSITKQIRRFYSDILLCIVNVRTVPSIYANAAYHRACCPMGFTNNKGKWQYDDWMKCIAITLAMLKSCYNKEGYKVALNYNEKGRDYLFGRLIAVADVVEITASAGTDAQYRQTNAVRFFSAMQQRPAATWNTISERLKPYFSKIGYKKTEIGYRKLIDDIYHSADDGVLSDNSPLSPRFLEGYYNQRYELLYKKEG